MDKNIELEFVEPETDRVEIEGIGRWNYTPAPPPPPPPSFPPSFPPAFPPPAFTCFPAGTPVLMANGLWKPIEHVAVGDRVAGLFGYDNEVIALDRPVLAERPLYLINNDFRNTADHMMWTGRQFGVLSKQTYLENDYRKMVPVQYGDGRIEERLYVGVDPDWVAEIGMGDTLFHVRHGEVAIDTVVAEAWPPETRLYALVLGGSHTLFVGSGYAVSGWANDQDFDYKRGRPIDAMPKRHDDVREHVGVLGG